MNLKRLQRSSYPFGAGVPVSTTRALLFSASCITEDAIYYTGYQCPNHNYADYQLHKYTFEDGTSDILLDNKCYQQFNLIGDRIYCLVTNSEFDAYGLAYFDIKTQTTVDIPTGDINDFQYAVSACGGKIIYLNMNEFLYSYDIETQEFKKLTNEFGRISFMAAASDDLMFFTIWTKQEIKIYQCNNGEVSSYSEGRFYQNDLLEIVDNKPILMSSSNSNGKEIEGDERLNVVVE